MLARDYIKERIKSGFCDIAHLIATNEDGDWWHVHQDEEVPPDYELTIKLPCETVSSQNG